MRIEFVCPVCRTLIVKDCEPQRARRKKYCSVQCASAAKALAMHRRVASWLTLNPRQRFLMMVDRRPEGCWPWRGTIGANGYGNVRIGGKRISAHRLAYEVFCGPIPAGLLVCHRCDHPSCCNPGHLFLGTSKDNSADMLAKGRHTTNRKNVPIAA